MIEIELQKEHFRMTADCAVERKNMGEWHRLYVVAFEYSEKGLRFAALAWLAGYDYGMNIGIELGHRMG